MSDGQLPSRVVFICATYLPRVTGVGTVLHTWAPKLLSLGVAVTVVAPEYPPTPYYPLPSYPDGLRVVRLPSRPAPFVLGIQQPLAYGTSWENLLKELHGQDAIVHAQDVLVAATIALRLGRQCRLPVLLHGHYPIGEGDFCDWLPFPLPRRARPLLNRGVTWVTARRARSTCRRASAVAVVSPYMREVFRRHRIADPLLVPCGIEVPTQPPRLDIRSRHAIPNDAWICLFVGRTDPDKQISHLLHALALLRQRDKRVHLLIVGGGPYLPRYMRQAQSMSLNGNVTFAGWVPYRDVWAYYQQSDLFLIASPYEAQGLVVVEAQAMGLPVVGYRGGGVSLCVADGQSGVLTDHTPESLAEAAFALLTDTERRKAMATVARAQAAAYTIERTFPSLLEVYAQVRASAVGKVGVRPLQQTA